MAGIGFELKKLFSKKGLFAIVKAYGYASIVCTGPMLLGISFLLGIGGLSIIGGASGAERQLLNSMITYTLLASLVVSNILAMVTTRFCADAIYKEKDEVIMPSFHGSISIMLVFGSIAYGIFLWNSGIPLSYQVLCLTLFGELVVVWTEINYLTAVKDYKGIMYTFFVALVVALGLGYIMILFDVPVILALLLAVTIGYGIMMVWYYSLLLRYFQEGQGSSFYFLKWLDQYPKLAYLGCFMVLGLFTHLVLMWFSPIGVKVKGLFWGSPYYDVSALFAFLSILVTTVNFVTSVEVNFYPKYRNYFALYNGGGTLPDILQSETEMKVTLQKELGYTFSKQVFTSIVFIVVGTIILTRSPFNFTEETLGIFRILCVGYAFYAIGNCIMLITLYFVDFTGAFWGGLIFFIVSSGGTLLLRDGDIRYYGLGFLIGGIAFTVYSLIRLRSYLKKLSYHILSRQPIIVEERRSFIYKLSDFLEKRYERKYGEGRDIYEEQ